MQGGGGDKNPPGAGGEGGGGGQARYRGEWKFDEIHGFGTMLYPNRCQYVGKFVSNQRAGQVFVSSRSHLLHAAF